MGADDRPVDQLLLHGGVRRRSSPLRDGPLCAGVILRLNRTELSYNVARFVEAAASQVLAAEPKPGDVRQLHAASAFEIEPSPEFPAEKQHVFVSLTAVPW